MKKQAYKVVFYNMDSNTTEQDIIYEVSEENARAWADMMCTEEQEVESVELYHAWPAQKNFKKVVKNVWQTGQKVI